MMPLPARLAALVLTATVIAPLRASAAGQDQTIESQIRERLSRRGRGEIAFREAVGLIELIDRSAQTASRRDAHARLALYRLRSMKNAAEAIDGPGTPSYALMWVDAHRSELVYSEPAGKWLLNADVIVKIHDTWRDTEVADDVAWLMVENGLPGECEGNVPCYVRWQNHLSGEYLRRHPRGRHADEANRDIARTLDSIMSELARMLDSLFHPDTECGELHADLNPLAAAIRASRSQAKAQALAAIDRFARLCRH